MRRSIATVAMTACLGVCAACGGSTISPSSIASTGATIGFGGLSADGAPVTTYAESGFTVSTMSGDWSVRADYGHPAPFIQFSAAAGSTVNGEIQIRASDSTFYFKSVDLYSSTLPIPYTIRGVRNGTTVFTVADTVPNPSGAFRTVVSPNAADAIDTLSIMLTNAAAACCRNPMGLDTIVLASEPSTLPTSFSLSGQVIDGSSGTGIPGATVAIVDGPNAGNSVRTDGAGNYAFSNLLQSGFTVTASATSYASQSKGVTLTSSQTMSFQLTRQQPPAPPPLPPGATAIGFSGLITDGASVTTYSESGFTVSATSGPWIASSTFGNPAPFVRFYAPPGTTVTGELRVAAGGSLFSFYSIDLYSSTTSVPYTITGLRNGSTVFTLTATLPNPVGNFRTVTNPNAAATIDTVSIVLMNAAASCSTCQNPMGLDTIVLAR